MAWRDRVGNSICKFRGIEIHLESTSTEPGRRVQVHEYPLRDQPYAEDLGRNKREHQITGYLLGDDYDVVRDQLIEAFEKPGAGEFFHPYYGTYQAIITASRISESTSEGGICRVTFTALRADDKPLVPAVTTDTQSVTEARAEAARQSALEDFTSEYAGILELATDRVAAVQATMTEAMQGVQKVIGDITGPLAELIRAPADLGGQILEFIAQVTDQINEPLRALGIYEDLFSAGSYSSAGPNAPLVSRRQVQAQNAMVNLVRRGAVIESANAAARWEFVARQDAQTGVETLHTGITAQLETDPPPTPQVAQSLVALRAAVVSDLRTRGAALPELTAYTPPATLPALVIAQRLYGDAKRADEIVLRNKVRHPGAVPGGDPLEVLHG
jgi:prophage DNA circulation protein